MLSGSKLKCYLVYLPVCVYGFLGTIHKFSPADNLDSGFIRGYQQGSELQLIENWCKLNSENNIQITIFLACPWGSDINKIYKYQKWEIYWRYLLKSFIVRWKNPKNEEEKLHCISPCFFSSSICSSFWSIWSVRRDAESRAALASSKFIWERQNR